MSERSIVIEIPGTPDKCLAPNAARRTHYMHKSKVSSEMRDRGMLAALSVRPTGVVPMFAGPVTLYLTVLWGKGERRVDLSAIPAMTKPFEDGLTDAGIWDDDRQVTRLIVEQGKDPARVGRTVLRVVEAAHG